MKQVPQRIALIVLVALGALFLAARVRYPGKAPVKLPAENCDASLWNHVYSPERLRVIEGCTSVEGRVVSLQHAEDGDLHIALDPDQKSVLNLANGLHGRGRLVVELICEYEPDPESVKARAACAGFKSRVAIPNVGDHIRVTGAFVNDRGYGWNEVHPVTRIEMLP